MISLCHPFPIPNWCFCSFCCVPENCEVSDFHHLKTKWKWTSFQISVHTHKFWTIHSSVIMTTVWVWNYFNLHSFIFDSKLNNIKVDSPESWIVFVFGRCSSNADDALIEVISHVIHLFTIDWNANLSQCDISYFPGLWNAKLHSQIQTQTPYEATQ